MDFNEMTVLIRCRAWPDKCTGQMPVYRWPLYLFSSSFSHLFLPFLIFVTYPKHLVSLLQSHNICPLRSGEPFPLTYESHLWPMGPRLPCNSFFLQACYWSYPIYCFVSLPLHAHGDEPVIILLKKFLCVLRSFKSFSESPLQITGMEV